MARLLTMAFRLLIDGLHGELAARGWEGMRPAFGFVLLALSSGPATGTELAATLGTSKQAVSQLVDDLVAAGYAVRTVHPDDARARHIALTGRGHLVLAAVEEIYTELEGGWAEILGPDRLDQLRADLHTVLLASYGGALPPVRPEPSN
jgi:DNA-binding MarR family transcriptional regulator